MNSRDEMLADENRRIRVLRISADLLVRELMTRTMSLSMAQSLIDGFRALALSLFPGKSEAVELIYMPRFRRALREAGIFDKGRSLSIVSGGKEGCPAGCDAGD